MNPCRPRVISCKVHLKLNEEYGDASCNSSCANSYHKATSHDHPSPPSIRRKDPSFLLFLSHGVCPCHHFNFPQNPKLHVSAATLTHGTWNSFCRCEARSVTHCKHGPNFPHSTPLQSLDMVQTFETLLHISLIELVQCRMFINILRHPPANKFAAVGTSRPGYIDMFRRASCEPIYL